MTEAFYQKRCLVILLIGFFMISAILIAYRQVGVADFVNYDDTVYVTKNRTVQDGLTWKGVVFAFTTHESINWHPLTWFSHMLDCELYGMNPAGHHRTSLLFHMANSLLLFMVFHQMTGAVWRSAFVAALFALHPMNVESVAWISERKNVLSTFFGFLSIAAYIRYVRKKQIVSYLLCLLFLCLGLMAKAMLVTLPFVLLLLDVWPLGRFYGKGDEQAATKGIGRIKGRRALQLIFEKIPLFLVVLLLCITTFLDEQRIGGVQSLAHFSFPVRVSCALVAYTKYVAKTFWPYHLSVFYPYPGGALPIWQVFGAALFVVGVSVLAVHGVNRTPYIAVGWFWFLGTLVPVIGLVQIGGQAMADRYAYIPLIGLFVMMSWGITDLVGRGRYRRWGLSTCSILILLILSGRTFVQVGCWKDSVSLFENAIKVTDGNWLAHNNLGLALYKQGRVDDAIYHYRMSLEIYPEHDKAARNLGDALVKQGRFDEAMKYYRKTIRLNPGDAVAHYNLGILLLKQNRRHEAYASFAETIRNNPDYAEAYDYMGLILVSHGEFQKAEVFFSRAVQVAPDYIKARKHLNENSKRLSNMKMRDGQ